MENQFLDASPLHDWVPTDVHHWEGKEENVLVLNYTLTCALTCDFCCYHCHPKRNEKMPIELAQRLINEAASMNSFSSVGFTGGEPMLYYEELVTLGTLLKAKGLPFTIATAGHWATSATETMQMVGVLSRLGLLRLNISHDPSHAQFVPSGNIIHIAQAAEVYHLPIYIIGTFFSTDEKIELLLPELVGNRYVHFINKYVAKVGRASKKSISQETYQLNLQLDALCCYRRVNHDITVFYDGETYPCCSTFNRSTKGISIGNANEMSLKSLWEKAEGSISLRIMKRQGFGELYRIIQQHDPLLYLELPSGNAAVGPCSLCHQLFSDKTLTPKIKRFFDQYEAGKVDNLLSFLVNRLGLAKTLSIIEQ